MVCAFVQYLGRDFPVTIQDTVQVKCLMVIFNLTSFIYECAVVILIFCFLIERG